MSGGPGNVPMAYQPANSGQADQGWSQIFQSMMPMLQQFSSSVLPQYQQAVSSIMSNPYGASGQAGANAASATGLNTVAPMQLGGAQSLYDMAGQAGPAASQILQTGFDPQRSLYNQQAGQTMDQANAINSMYGLGSSPYGAGVANDAMTNFNLGWQNNLLGRENTAAQGYGSLMGTAAQGYGDASSLGNAGVGTMYNSSMLPYNAYMGMQNNNLGALGQLSTAYGNALGQGSNMMGDITGYLGTGQNATGINQQGQQQQWQQAAAPWGGLGSLLGMGIGGATSTPAFGQAAFGGK